MDITVYDKILAALQEYNSTLEQNYGNVVVGTSPTNPSYPHTVFEEIRNDPYQRTNVRLLDSIDNLGYEMVVYAKTKGKIDKQTIARIVAGKLDDFLTNVIGLERISMSPQPLLNDSSTYGVNVRYGAKYNNYRAKIL